MRIAFPSSGCDVNRLHLPWHAVRHQLSGTPPVERRPRQGTALGKLRDGVFSLTPDQPRIKTARTECRAEKNPQFAKIDLNSSAGLGNTSDEPYGPTVSHVMLIHFLLVRTFAQDRLVVALISKPVAQAVLLVGFEEQEISVFNRFMAEMGATMVKVESSGYEDVDFVV